MPGQATPRRRQRRVTKTTRKPARGGWPPESTRVQSILDELGRLYPDADCELERRNPFQLLCATILSAQCTDERVNRVTPALFARFPTPAALAKASPPQLEALIRSTGFFRNKARNMVGAARALEENHAGQVPRAMAALLALPGVARKTANVVLGTAFGIAEGVVVDTHVMRLSQRMGLTRGTTPEVIERDLMAIIPPERWILLSHQLIRHGRRVCQARRPDCDHCTIVPNCPGAFRES
jgi:endonuclease-3